MPVTKKRKKSVSPAPCALRRAPSTDTGRLTTGDKQRATCYL